MGYQLLAELVMLLHFGFLAYVALGGFLAWRRPWLIVPHVGAAVWGALSATVGIPCPLTAWEHEARRGAGEQGLTRGFIDTYLTGVVYPREHLRTAQLLVAVLVLVAWTGFVLRSRRSVTAPAKGGRRCAVPSTQPRTCTSPVLLRERSPQPRPGYAHPGFWAPTGSGWRGGDQGEVERVRGGAR